MTDADAMLAAVRDRPADDTPRLVYADWLDDHDQPEWASLIRAQIELARMEAAKVGGVGSLFRKRRTDLRRMAGAAFSRIAGTVLGAKIGAPAIYNDGPTYTNGGGLKDVGWQLGRNDHIYAVVRRGFVDEARLPLARLVGGECPSCRGLRGNWDELNPGIDPATSCVTCRGEGAVPGVAAALGRLPLSRVTLTDAEPDDDANTVTTYSWWDSDPGRNDRPLTSMVGADLFRLLPGVPISDWGEYRKSYPTRAAALDALSAACLAYCADRAAKAEPAPAAWPGSDDRDRR